MKSSNHLPVSHIRLFSRMALPEDFSMLSVICYFDVISENIFYICWCNLSCGIHDFIESVVKDSQGRDHIVPGIKRPQRMHFSSGIRFL